MYTERPTQHVQFCQYLGHCSTAAMFQSVLRGAGVWPHTAAAVCRIAAAMLDNCVAAMCAAAARSCWLCASTWYLLHITSTWSLLRVTSTWYLLRVTRAWCLLCIGTACAWFSARGFSARGCSAAPFGCSAAACHCR